MVYRLIILGAFLMCLGSLSAQFSKGDKMIGGSIGFQYRTIPKEDFSQFVIGLSPTIGFFASRHVVAGPQLTINYQETHSSNNSFSSLFSIGIGPFLRYYGRIGDRVNFFVHASPALGWSAERYTTDNHQPYLKIFQVQWEAGPGIAILLNKNVALEPSVFYKGVYRNTAIANTLVSSNKTVEHGVVFNIGLQVFLVKNKKGE
ncbi:MAG: hypothetical protein U0T73_04085 [Chitinophagales bacterium]